MQVSSLSTMPLALSQVSTMLFCKQVHMHEGDKLQRLPKLLEEWHEDAAIQLRAASQETARLQAVVHALQQAHALQPLVGDMTAALNAKATLEAIAPVGLWLLPTRNCKAFFPNACIAAEKKAIDYACTCIRSA